MLSSRLALLGYTRQCAVFQNRSVPEVVEQVLRSHGLEGPDFEFRLERTYPPREIITQWRETDLQFIQRILSEVGIYWRTEMDDVRGLEKTCENCPPEGKVMPMVRRCSRWSEVTINYQTRICGTFYNPETKQIQEFKYCGVSFDGWKDKLCQFWEAKARYDQFFDAFGDPKGWWKGYRSGLSQAGRHQAVATVNQPLKVVWIFMQPVSYRYFSKMFKDFKDIITRWVP
ncbi:Tox-REase-5 domain-containing protein [Enterobacter cloacae]|nr:contractile injection system protein, VgrG/Pvc8 family [Enterobacter cloacae]MCK6804243.1 Tox-REase-5 domain-containing protein [Enterobacter cloacae]MCK6826841.1 Tox-REase-5 domain-containing protein [Enterobacter cloacae]MCM7171026.1 contractile injection system protein, VgrG/Pvc8 family [Enterobacter cloacae]UPW30029.1 Tox-REase-5 domain-containing protein [Enterobacter cloacae]